ncbi:FHA domain-containing protein [Massilia sp. MS-15]|uniref:FHA domain-containing protein n=1 Tax=Massilia sp. MS-15 TaxID=2878200 RepID=UPI001CD55534|nr:FHA domain-containing protein [Massilia sp. MS-15]MCA1245793.1 FHA domain-containing protein [Massilia sp. MS-15]
MNRCRHPAHPHCTVWVMPGADCCAHGHAQPPSGPPVAGGPAAAQGLPSGFEAISALRAGRGATTLRATETLPARPQLHISGFDPRAAGGRQAIRLDLRGMPADCAAELRMLVRSGLRLNAEHHAFQRTSRGDWRPVFLEFSSRGLEHGQYRIDIELHSRQPGHPGSARTWSCSPVILVPRPDASLGEIHQTFLATHKNVRVTADDAGIARVQAPGGGRLDIEVHASNASIAQLDLRDPREQGGRLDLAFSSIAWDEDLIEIDVPLAAAPHPCPAERACLVHVEPDSAAQRHLRLFALDECVLGRYEDIEPDADLLLAHHGEHGLETGGLTRRLSGRHALIRQGRHGFEIEDVSRYGLLLDGVWPGKHAPVPLRLGMRIALTASIRGVAELEVTALWPHGLVLHRVDAGARAEAFCLLAPETDPGSGDGVQAGVQPRAAALPPLFHRGGGFWHRDPATGIDTPLAPGMALERLRGLGAALRFTARPYPEQDRGRDRRALSPAPSVRDLRTPARSPSWLGA